jgi:5-methylcytosine-specific restriction protein B
MPEVDGDRHAHWARFLEAWPVERLRRMTLEEYTNDRREDALVYWLEFRLADLGGIRGGSAFKFGVARRGEEAEAARKGEGGRRYDAQYLWQARFGASAAEAFLKVRQVILDVVDAVRAGRLEVIDRLPLGNMARWKLAFLYQDRAAPLLFPIYKPECLFYHYQRGVDPGAAARQTPMSRMYRALGERLRGMDVFAQADGLWAAWERAQGQGPRDWLAPLLAFGLSGEAARRLCALAEVGSGEVPLGLEAALVEAGASAGDRLALWDGAAVRARGLLRQVAAGAVAWEQIPSDIALDEPPPLGLAEVIAWRTREAIWGESPAQRAPAASTGAAGPCAPPQNIIFYGPPGTGKTFRVVREALRRCGVDPDGLAPEQVTERLRALQAEGRVEVLTFHPSYGYEEFVEGIRPVLGRGEELGYRCVDGVFKRIALLATAEGLPGRDPEAAEGFAALWERLLTQIEAADGEYLVEGLGEGLYALQKGRGGRLEARRVLSVETGEPWVAEAPLVLDREALAALWSARALFSGARAPLPEELTATVRRVRGHDRGVHPEVLWPLLRELAKLARRGAQARPGPDARRQQAREALAQGRGEGLRFDAATPGYVLIIDEINRGNLGKVAGELITLWEPNRRLGAPDATVVLLPTSGEPFAAPPNLHLLATMNTADRSIALLDVALRRRFAFVEVMPDAALLTRRLTAQGADPPLARLLGAALAALNERVAFLYDRDHQIGHAYLMDALDEEAARAAFAERILPLLQEYFYDAWDRICLVLGCPYDEQGRPLRDAPHCLGPRGYRAPMILARVQTERALLGIDRGDYEPRLAFAPSPQLLTPGIEPRALRELLQALLPAPLSPDEELLF